MRPKTRRQISNGECHVESKRKGSESDVNAASDHRQHGYEKLIPISDVTAFRSNSAPEHFLSQVLFLFIKSIPGAAVLQKQGLQIGKCTAGDLGAEGDMKDNLIEGGMKDLQN